MDKRSASATREESPTLSCPKKFKNWSNWTLHEVVANAAWTVHRKVSIPRVVQYQL